MYVPSIISNYYTIRVTLNTKSDTARLFPMASKMARSNVTNDPLPKRWHPLGGLYVVSSLIKVSKWLWCGYKKGHFPDVFKSMINEKAYNLLHFCIILGNRKKCFINFVLSISSGKTKFSMASCTLYIT